MFAPGLFGAGDAVRRFGADAVASAGCALYLACAFMTYSYAADRDAAGRYPARAFEDVLIVLGVAWNLTFVAGSAMLVPRARGEEREGGGGGGGLRRAHARDGGARAGRDGVGGVRGGGRRGGGVGGAALEEVGWRGLCVLTRAARARSGGRARARSTPSRRRRGAGGGRARRATKGRSGTRARGGGDCRVTGEGAGGRSSEVDPFGKSSGAMYRRVLRATFRDSGSSLALARPRARPSSAPSRRRHNSATALDPTCVP